jgi:uncharacterized protein
MGGLAIMAEIIILANDISVRGALYETPTGNAIRDILPLESVAAIWGDEIYFDIPLTMNLEPGARSDVEVGEMAYWPEGPAFCIFFGPTPVSTTDKPRAYSPVTVFGRILHDPAALRSVMNNDVIRIALIRARP